MAKCTIWVLGLLLVCVSPTLVNAASIKSLFASLWDRQNNTPETRVSRAETVTTSATEMTLSDQKLVMDATVASTGLTLSFVEGDIVKSDLKAVSACNWVKLDLKMITQPVIVWKYSLGIIKFGLVIMPNKIPYPIINNNMPKYDLPLPIETDRWYHICFTWQHTDGMLRYYQDGVLLASGLDHGIVGGSLIHISQGGDLSFGTGFQISRLDVWGSVLDDNQITIMNECPLNMVGDLFSWMDTKVTVVPELHDLLQKSDTPCDDKKDVVSVGCTVYELSGEQATYNTADLRCQSIGEGAIMAVIPDEETANTIASAMRSDELVENLENGFWIRRAHHGNGVNHHGNGQSSTVTKKPNNNVGRHPCKQLRKGEILKEESDTCSKKKGYICQREVC